MPNTSILRPVTPEMTFANSVIAYSGLVVGSRLPLINSEVECLGRLIQMGLAGFLYVDLVVLTTSSVGQGGVSCQNVYSVSSWMGNLIPQNQAAKVLVLPRLARVASGL